MGEISRTLMKLLGAVKRSNYISAIKELYRMDVMDDIEYSKLLVDAIEAEGFKINPKWRKELG